MGTVNANLYPTLIFQDRLFTLQWRHNERNDVSNHMRFHCLLSFWFRHWSKKTSKFRVTGLCAGKSLVTGEFPAQKVSNAVNASIRWRRHEKSQSRQTLGIENRLARTNHCVGKSSSSLLILTFISGRGLDNIADICSVRFHPGSSVVYLNNYVHGTHFLCFVWVYYWPILPISLKDNLRTLEQ